MPRQIGLELRVHFNDESAQQFSGGQRMLMFWQKVQEQIETFKKNHAGLSQIHAYVTLDKTKLAQDSLNPLVRKFAEEIVSCVLKESQTCSSNIIIIPDWRERTLTDFTDYPIMQEYVREVVITKGFYAFWDANVRACHVGIDYSQLANVVREKNEKARNYERENVDELWLLIAAPHDNVFNAMHAFPDQIDFDAEEILDACAWTPFDKIFFWSSPPHEWHRQIWPKESNVQS